MEIVKRLAWFFIHKDDSFSVRMRKKRFKLFLDLTKSDPKPMKILDVGGVQFFWESVGYTGPDQVKITLINFELQKVNLPNFNETVGDARDLSQFRDKEFDIAFSNSLIEHVGDFNDQKKAGRELMRVGKRYYVQTPYFYFPMEQHILVPFFQFMPQFLQVFILMHFKLIYQGTVKDRETALRLINTTRLLSIRELKKIFPGCTIYKEKIFGITKSIIAYGGW